MPPPNGEPFIRVDVKQYVVSAPAGSDVAPIQASPANKRRTYFAIQNTGSQLGFFAWDQAYAGASANAARPLQLLPGDAWVWDRAIPQQAANFSSTLGTTFAVIEGTESGA